MWGRDDPGCAGLSLPSAIQKEKPLLAFVTSHLPGWLPGQRPGSPGGSRSRWPHLSEGRGPSPSPPACSYCSCLTGEKPAGQRGWHPRPRVSAKQRSPAGALLTGDCRGAESNPRVTSLVLGSSVGVSLLVLRCFRELLVGVSASLLVTVLDHLDLHGHGPKSMGGN